MLCATGATQIPVHIVPCSSVVLQSPCLCDAMLTGSQLLQVEEASTSQPPAEPLLQQSGRIAPLWQPQGTYDYAAAEVGPC